MNLIKKTVQKKMFSIGIIGVDGVGKTTIAKSLVNSLPFKAKYLYMGMAAQSSNFVLPTSYLVHLIKLRNYRKLIKKTCGSPPNTIPAYRNAYVNKRVQKTLLWKFGRFLNRVAEAWFRQAVCMVYRLRGFVVICDRHFLFDMAPEVSDSQVQKRLRLDQLFYWMLSRLYPKPNLTIFLDAPAEIVFARKQELTPLRIHLRRQAILEAGKTLTNFIRVDAAQPPHKVTQVIKKHILSFYLYKMNGESSEIELYNQKDISSLNRRDKESNR